MGALRVQRIALVFGCLTAGALAFGVAGVHSATQNHNRFLHYASFSKRPAGLPSAHSHWDRAYAETDLHDDNLVVGVGFFNPYTKCAGRLGMYGGGVSTMAFLTPDRGQPWYSATYSFNRRTGAFRYVLTEDLGDDEAFIRGHITLAGVLRHRRYVKGYVQASARWHLLVHGLTPEDGSCSSPRVYFDAPFNPAYRERGA